MKNTCKKLSTLFLVWILTLSLTVPALAADLAEINAVTNALSTCAAPSAAKEISGASQLDWAVWMDGEIAGSGSSSDPDENAGHLASLAAAFAPHIYGVGSVSKIYTTVAVMQLAEAGKLSLDKPVTTYLPNFKMADPRYKDITVRMLLNHSSGLMGSSMTSGLLYDDASEAATDTLLACLASQRLKAAPGAYSVYCNDGFTLAQLVVEAVSGMNFQDYLRANILDPAGLKQTFFPDELLSGSMKPNVVPVYQAGDERPLPVDCLGVVGTGGVYATAEDLARFGGALTGGTLLSQSSLDAMAAPEYARGLWPEEGPDALSFGLGWDSVEWYPFSQSGITALVKGGDTQYYHSGLVVLPEYKLAAAVVSSGGVSTYNEMAASQLLAAVLEAKGVKVDQSPVTLPEAQPAAMPKELTELSGYYGSAYVYEIGVAEDGTLTMRYLNMPDVPELTFTYYSDGSFRDEENSFSLRLVEEENGQTYLQQWTFTEVPGLGGLPGNSYAAMKLPENQVSPELQEHWEKLMSETSLLPMNERYSSQVYTALGAAMAAEAETDSENAPGYVGSMQIVDENRIQYVAQIPGTAGRDGVDVEFRRDGDGVLWMFQSNGSAAMDITAVPDLSAGKGSAVCTIQSNGFVRWYRTGSTAGKTMTVRMPENAGFWVYDSAGGIAASSVLWGDDSVELPEDGLVVFAGDPGAQFQLTFQ